jgi:hypothetical protein
MVHLDKIKEIKKRDSAVADKLVKNREYVMDGTIF